MYTHTYTHTRTHARTHAHTHTHTNTHTTGSEWQERALHHIGLLLELSGEHMDAARAYFTTHLFSKVL